MNSTATAWNSALPVRPMLAPSGSTKLATVREIRRSLSARSEEHTSELQSPCNLVCRLLLEKKKNEFGGRRSFKQQLEDIEMGTKVLERVFHDKSHPVVVPAWNSFTCDTVRLLDRLGCRWVT